MPATKLRPPLRGPMAESGARSPLSTQALGRLAPYKVPSEDDRCRSSRAAPLPTLAGPSMPQQQLAIGGEPEGRASGTNNASPSIEQLEGDTEQISAGGGPNEESKPTGGERSEPQGDHVITLPFSESQEAADGPETNREELSDATLVQENAQPNESHEQRLEAAKEECSRILAAYLESLVAAAVSERSHTGCKGEPHDSPPSGSPSSWNSAHAQYESALLTSLVQGRLPEQFANAQQDEQPAEQQQCATSTEAAQGARDLTEHPSPACSAAAGALPSTATSVGGDADEEHEPGGRERCIRNGCSNLAAESRDWDNEYCSCECLVAHCRDVFKAWVGQRKVASGNLVQ